MSSKRQEKTLAYSRFEVKLLRQKTFIEHSLQLILSYVKEGLKSLGVVKRGPESQVISRVYSIYS